MTHLQQETETEHRTPIAIMNIATIITKLTDEMTSDTVEKIMVDLLGSIHFHLLGQEGKETEAICKQFENGCEYFDAVFLRKHARERSNWEMREEIEAEEKTVELGDKAKERLERLYTMQRDIRRDV
jgi:hypothetical protein